MLPGFGRGNLLKEAWAKRDWEEALRASRADICQYTIWHRTNTEPALARHNPAAKQLLTIDINALGEMTSDLCALRLGMRLSAMKAYTFDI